MHRKLTDFLLEYNKTQSELFSGSDETLARRAYRASHPTEIAALKCMDGRLNLSLMTKTPIGVIQPFRNIGGDFDLGWPYFGKLMEEWVNYTVSKGRHGLVLATYHFSKGESHRGCRGHNYDMEAGRQAAQALKEQIETVFGLHHAVIYPMLVGIETDEDSLILHGSTGKTLNLALEAETTPEEFRFKLQEIYPDMETQMLADLLPLVVGNARHSAEVRASGRLVEDAEHREQILGIGRGFDWLHLRNKALLVGPYSYNLAAPITEAAGILLSNLQAGRISKEEGVVMIASAVYRDAIGIQKQLAIAKAHSLATLGLETIKAHVPELVPYLRSLVGTVNMNTRLFEPIPFEAK